MHILRYENVVVSSTAFCIMKTTGCSIREVLKMENGLARQELLSGHEDQNLIFQWILVLVPRANEYGLNWLS